MKTRCKKFVHCLLVCLGCIFCIIYTIYSSIQSGNVVSYLQPHLDATITSDLDHSVTNLLRNNSNMTFLIGLSPNKCGSSYLIRLLDRYLRKLKYEVISHRAHFELKYWDYCPLFDSIPSWTTQYYKDWLKNTDQADKIERLSTKCSFDGYLQKFVEGRTRDKSLLNKYLHNVSRDHLYLLEKTPTYIRYYHSLYLLSEYAHSVGTLYFYISLRNPNDRLWSDYWMEYQWKYNASDPSHIQSMIRQIDDEVDHFPEAHPKYQRVLDAIKMENGPDIDELNVVQLWKEATYDLWSNFNGDLNWKEMMKTPHFPIKMPRIAVSCYYPQILTLYHTFNEVKIRRNSSLQLQDRLRIFQFEWIKREKKGGIGIIQDLLIWLQEEMYGNGMQIVKRFQSESMRRSSVSLAGKSSFKPQHFNFGETELITKLDAFYSDCNLRLYSFLKKHPELILQNSYGAMATSFTLLVGLCTSLVTAIKINTKLGEIEGVTTSDPVHQFLNIPYAEPPVGELRWRPPKSLVTTPWEGVHDGTSWGNGCTQPSAMHAFNNDMNIPMVEDCLYLNIFTPYNFEDANDKLRPVMFWIHGGGLTMGTAASQIYNSSILATNEDIVVVTINYRLGRAAWFVDPALEGSPTGNGAATGFLDMIEALKWVQHNIESFGGDPNQVTIAGESGGGWAVCGLMVTPLARGLFQRSIQMSGSCIKSMGRLRTTNEAKALTKQFATFLNLSTVEDMRSIDMQSIVDAGYGQTEGNPIPALDGYVFPMDTLDLFQNGYINGDSVMIGTLFRESFTAEPFNIGFVPKDNEDLIQFWNTLYHDSQVKRIKEAYPVDEEGIKAKVWPYPSWFDDGRSAVLVSTQLQTDCTFRCGSILQTELITESVVTRKVPVYFYQFGYIEEPWDRVSHGQDIFQLFGREIPEGHPMKSNYTIYSEDFTKIAQNFFGAYIRGEGVVIDGIDSTVNNGKYIQVVDEVKAVDLSELDVIKKRCEVMYELGNDAFDSYGFCIGMYDFDQAIDVWTDKMDGESCKEGEGEGCNEDANDKTKSDL